MIITWKKRRKQGKEIVLMTDIKKKKELEEAANGKKHLKRKSH